MRDNASLNRGGSPGFRDDASRFDPLFAEQLGQTSGRIVFSDKTNRNRSRVERADIRGDVAGAAVEALGVEIPLPPNAAAGLRRAGALEVVVGIRPESLREAIVDVKAGRFHVSATLARRSVTASDQAGDDTTSKRASMISLTAREHQVLRLIAEGLSNRQVARSLSISEHGVKRTVGIILAKLNCPNRTLAVVRAIESRLLVM